ncbi:hypothetical protein LTR66_006506 [Elasticomyces elasticus]|nr:hypothetical protein LTR66_006506 [Elasticomyces elasticus]
MSQPYYHNGPPPQSYGNAPYGGMPQQYGAPPAAQSYYQQGGYPPQNPGMQYQQGPPQQVIVQQKKQDRGCLSAWYDLLPEDKRAFQADVVTVSPRSAAASSARRDVNAAPTAASAQRAAAEPLTPRTTRQETAIGDGLECNEMSMSIT